MPRIFKTVRVSCHVCGKTWKFSPKDAGFVEINENDPAVPQCLWCKSFVEQANDRIVEGWKNATAQR
jgi:hypothetical protein